MECNFSKTSFVWSDKHAVKWQSDTSTLSRPLAPGTSGPVCHLCHVFYGVLVIFRQQHGMLPGLLWVILVHEFTANKHNNFSHFSVLEAQAEVWMFAEQEGPAPCKLRAVHWRVLAKSLRKQAQRNSCA